MGERPLEPSGSPAPLELFFRALPTQVDPGHLRKELLRVSAIDESQTWAHSSAYVTYDKRVLTPSALSEACAAAAQNARAALDHYFGAIRTILTAVMHGDDRHAVHELIRLGESAEADEDAPSALGWYRSALAICQESASGGVRTLLLRRLGRASLTLGDFEDARRYYGDSLSCAEFENDVAGQVVAHTGLGNIAGYQGFFVDALEHIHSALRTCGEAFPELRGPLLINGAVMCMELGQLDAAAASIAEASTLWASMSAADQSSWYNCRGMISLRRGELEVAEAMLQQALNVAPTEFQRAMALDNLADLFIQQGHSQLAESFARAAEEAALRAASPRALAEIYVRLGKIMRMRGDGNGVTFFEKALEICRLRSYPYLQASAWLEYGIFRLHLGEDEEARALLNDAAKLFDELGATRLAQHAAETLQQLPASKETHSLR